MKESLEPEFHSNQEFKTQDLPDLLPNIGRVSKSTSISCSNLKPIIGITTYGRNNNKEFSSQTAYTDAIRIAGGIPILLPSGESYAEHLLELLDGIILSGGGDIQPHLYNGNFHPMVYCVDGERDCFEFKLSKLVLAWNLPVLGICRGLQVLNVSDGGDLIEHVPDHFGMEIPHRLEQPHSPTKHIVNVDPCSRLAQAMQATVVNVPSWHHQAVNSVPNGWQVVATAPDGVIEAIEHKEHPWAIAVQWHPEISAQVDESQAALFKSFVKAAVGYKLAKLSN